MRSPDPLLIQRWLLHPRPTGGRRIAAAYLAAAAGVVAAIAIISGSVGQSSSCHAQGFSCLGGYFRGIALAIVIGVVVVSAVSVTIKLGAAYLLSLLAAIPVVALLGVVLSLTQAAVLALPAMIIFAVAAPAVAAWTSTKII